MLLRGADGVDNDEIRRFMTKRFDTYEYLDVRDFDGTQYMAFGVLPD
jgi:hypothetical protein